MRDVAQDTSLDESLAKASTALRISTVVDRAKPVKSGAIVDTIEAIRSDPTIEALTPVATQTLQLVQSQIDNLDSATQILTTALDELTKIHPFVSVAVLAFKAALKFEMARRHNDKRIMLLHVRMNDMFSVLLMVRKIGKDQLDPNGVSIEQRLRARIGNIAGDIEKYSAMCDTFSKKRTVVKLFRSLEWEGKLEGFIKAFDDHKQALQEDLSIHASLGIERANATLLSVSEHVRSAEGNTSLLLLLRALRSPIERELISEIKQNGGPERVLQDEALMKKLIEKSAEKESQKDAKALSKDAQTALIKEISRDLSRSFADMIKENEDLFSRKFKAQETALREEMEVITRREGDRVIGAILSGPHDRIQDPDMYEVWKESGWRSTTKARSLVMALREYYSERRETLDSGDHKALEEIREILFSQQQPDSEKRKEIALVAMRGIRAEDLWALQYLTISRVQHLMEAFDDDSSSLVSVSEVNAFTNARPKDWSLPKWMAYWAAGFPNTLKYYFNRIQILMARIAIISGECLQTNRSFVDQFNAGWQSGYSIDFILAGVHKFIDESTFEDQLLERFKSYIDEEESRMRKRLKSVRYFIDAPNTLALVMGTGRIEKCLIQLIYLLLHRVWHVLRNARTIALQPRELGNIIDSFLTIFTCVQVRVDGLKAMCKLQNLDERTQLQKFSHGIYYYFSSAHYEELLKNEYWTTVYFQTEHLIGHFDGVGYLWSYMSVTEFTYEDLNFVKEDHHEDLFFPPHDDNLHVDMYDQDLRPNPILSKVDDGSRSNIDTLQNSDPVLRLLGDGAARSVPWSGTYTLRDFEGNFSTKTSAGIFHLTLPANDARNGSVTGSGVDGAGDFTIVGRLNGTSLLFNQQHTSTAVEVRRWQGSISEERNEIQGFWGLLATPEDNFDVLLDESGITSRFSLCIVPLRLPYLDPSPDELTSSRPRALWRFAIETVINVLRIRAGHFSWTYLNHRRQVRKRFLELYSRLDYDSSSWVPYGNRLPLSISESEELANIAAMCSDIDLRFYRRLCAALQRRRIFHWCITCDSCQRSELDTVRFICIDCRMYDDTTGHYAEATWNTIDLCPECIENSITRAGGKQHDPPHSLLQLRTTIPRRKQFSVEKQARQLVETLREEDKAGELHRSCTVCNETLEAPFWCCIDHDCGDKMHLCIDCKADKDAKYSPIFDLKFTNDHFSADGKALASANEPNAKTVGEALERYAKARAEASPDSHKISHSLVLYRGADISSSTSVVDNPTDEKLIALQEQLGSLETRMEERLGRLEQMLERIAAALGTPVMTETVTDSPAE